MTNSEEQMVPETGNAETAENEKIEETSENTENSPAVTDEKTEDVKYFKTKKIRFGPIEYQIVTQNLNGPCPLIALVNALVLKGKIEIPATYVVTSSDLLTRLTNIIIARTPTGNDPQTKEIFENNLEGVLNIIGTIVNGLDVNIRFSGVDKFEFTPALSLFDLVSINLYHVWLPDPQFSVLFDLVKDLNYNDLVVKMLGDTDEARMLQNFHEESVSQITFQGLASLLETMRDGELAVVFQNNHFSTILKRRDEIFKLVSDEGLADEPNVIWETFSSVDGDSIFVNADFGNFQNVTPPQSHVATAAPLTPPPAPIIDNSPIEQAVEARERPISVPPPKPPKPPVMLPLVSRSHTSDEMMQKPRGAPRAPVDNKPKSCEIM